MCRILVVWLQVWCMWLMHLCVHSHMNEHHDCVQNTAIFSVYEELEFLLYKIVSKWPWRLCTMAVEAVLVVMPLVLIYALSSNIRVMSEYFSIFLLSKCLRNASFEGMHNINYVFIPNAIRYLWCPCTDAIHELQQGPVFTLLCETWYRNFQQSSCQTKLNEIMWIIFGTKKFHDYHLGVNVVYDCCRTSTSTSSNVTSSSSDLLIEHHY